MCAITTILPRCWATRVYARLKVTSERARDGRGPRGNARGRRGRRAGRVMGISGARLAAGASASLSPSLRSGIFMTGTHDGPRVTQNRLPAPDAPACVGEIFSRRAAVFSRPPQERRASYPAYPFRTHLDASAEHQERCSPLARRCVCLPTAWHRRRRRPFARRRRSSCRHRAPLRWDPSLGFSLCEPYGHRPCHAVHDADNLLPYAFPTRRL